jgi:CheY-like chemotaxis protein
MKLRVDDFKKKTIEIKTKNSNSSYKFTVNDFVMNDTSTLRKVENLNDYNVKINNINYNSLKLKPLDISPRNTPAKNFINVIIVDDEVFTRQSTVRILYNISKELDIKINIIEAEDGVETIYLVYKAATQGVRISSIFSDENMNFMNGSRCSEIIQDIQEKKRMGEIPFYLVTAYDNIHIKKQTLSGIKQVLAKPLSKQVAKQIISQLCKII